MKAKEIAQQLVVDAKQENPENTDPVETAAQAVRNYLRDSEAFGDAFASLDIDGKVRALRIIRNVVSIATNLEIQGETETSED